MVKHEPGQASGGRWSMIDMADFLRPGQEGPEHQALLRLIGSLIDEPTDSRLD